VRALFAAPGQSSTLAEALGNNTKGTLSILLYLTALAVSLVVPVVAVGIDIVVAAMWVVPDPRIERRLRQPG
jgi:hypothetical protein